MVTQREVLEDFLRHLKGNLYTRVFCLVEQAYRNGETEVEIDEDLYNQLEQVSLGIQYANARISRNRGP